MQQVNQFELMLNRERVLADIVAERTAQVLELNQLVTKLKQEASQFEQTKADLYTQIDALNGSVSKPQV